MSKELTPINGRIEAPDVRKKESDYFEDEMQLTSFAGGVNGRMLQLTLRFNHIQLTKAQVRDLIATLSEWLD